MKEECKLCSVSVSPWGVQAQNTTDFSISSLMRPTVQHPGQVDPRHESLLLAAYLCKLGKLDNDSLCRNISPIRQTTPQPKSYYQPAGPMIKESGADAERALARYHPPPHYHPPHPPVLQQYGPYYPAELCYGRYYRPPGSYHLPPPQPDAQMVGVGSEPYPPPQYYGTPPCYQHSPQRIPYVEYRGCPCPLNACPKNVLIGPATGKAPTGGGPDVPSALAPPGAAFRPKARACVDSVADTHGSGKDPPLGPQPPSSANIPRPYPLPAIGGASPKRELYDVRENLRLAGDIPGPTEALGPPSPARGSAGVCAPQPPPTAPRRARLGKEMARRSLVGDDTGLLLSAPTPQSIHSEIDDDVLAISPPICAPIDLSSSDERTTPLVDVKKENEGPYYTSPRKPDAQALKEHNCTASLSDSSDNGVVGKTAKRRYSKSNLEIDMKDVQLQDGCKTNGIGEHVKLQKRRKVSSDQVDVIRIETVTKEPKKKSPHKVRKVIKSPTIEKKPPKRKLEDSTNGSVVKKLFVESPVNEDPRLQNIAALPEELVVTKPKTKSALLLDNLIRKNSVDRADAKGYSSDKELNPADLFLSPKDSSSQNSTKTVFNVNNNIGDKNVPTNGVRPNTIAAVTQLLEKKLSNKNACKVENVDSKITHSLKTVLKPTEKPSLKEECKIVRKCDVSVDKLSVPVNSEKQCKLVDIQTPICEVIDRISVDNNFSKEESVIEAPKLSKPTVPKVISNQFQNISSSDKLINESQHNVLSVKALDVELDDNSKEAMNRDKSSERLKLENKEKRHKANVEIKGKVEKVAKLLVSKKLAIKTDEAALLVEDACASPTPSAGRAGRQSRRRRSGAFGTRRAKRTSKHCIEMLDLEPRAPPRWSNGWKWDGEHYVSKVYLNNDSRLDRPARCWYRMSHTSGDRVARGDCVLLRASSARAQPFVARIARLWENPDDGEMMVSLVWYYRPEHTELGRQPEDAPDEVFASRHRDANSVACIEDKCYVLTFNEYCRYRKRLKAIEEGITAAPSIVPPMPASEINPSIATNDSKLPPTVSPELVLFCRKIYDFRSKKIQVPNK